MVSDEKLAVNLFQDSLYMISCFSQDSLLVFDLRQGDHNVPAVGAV